MSRALEIYRTLGNHWGMTQPTNNLALIAYHRGEFGRTRELLAQNAHRFAELGDVKGRVLTLSNLATMAYETGDATHAIDLFGECLPLCRTIGDRWLLANTLAGFGYALIESNRIEEAATQFRESLDTAVSIKAVPLELFARIGLIRVARLRGNGDYAAELLRADPEPCATEQRQPEKGGGGTRCTAGGRCFGRMVCITCVCLHSQHGALSVFLSFCNTVMPPPLHDSTPQTEENERG